LRQFGVHHHFKTVYLVGVVLINDDVVAKAMDFCFLFVFKLFKLVLFFSIGKLADGFSWA